MKPKQRTGMVLLGILGLMFLATILAVQYVNLTVKEIRYKAQREQRTELRPVAYNALELTMAVIHEFELIDEGLYSPAQGWGTPLRYSELDLATNVELTIDVYDESGKLSLQQMDEEQLQELFIDMNLSFTEAEELTDAYLDWIDEDDDRRLNGAEEDWYESEGRNVRPPNKPLTSWDDLRNIKGFAETFFDERGLPNQYYHQFTKSVSLYHQSKPNVNSTSAMVLDYLSKDSGIQADFLVDYLSGADGIPGTSDDEYLRSSQDAQDNAISLPPNVGFVSNLLRIEVRAKLGDASYYVNALVQPGGGASDASNANRRNGEDEKLNYPFRILNLVENDRIE